MYYDNKSKRRKELEESIKNMTKEEKRSSLRAPFWKENAKINTSSSLYKKVNKLWKEINEENDIYTK